MSTKCAVESCEHPRLSYDSMCRAHLLRLQQHGDVRADIPLGQMSRTGRRKQRKPTELEIAMAPAPAAGYGLLWLV